MSWFQQQQRATAATQGVAKKVSKADTRDDLIKIIEGYIKPQTGDKKTLTTPSDHDAAMRRKYWEYVRTNIDKFSDSELRSEIETEVVNAKAMKEILKLMLSSPDIAKFKHRAALEVVGPEILKDVTKLTNTSENIGSILKTVVNSIVRDKFRINELISERDKNIKRYAELTTQFENIKNTYSTVLDDNKTLMNERDELIDSQQNTISQNREYRLLQNKMIEKIRQIYASKKAAEHKLERLLIVLKKVDGTLGASLNKFIGSSADITLDDLLNPDELEGGGIKSSLIEKKILKKLDINDRDILSALSLFFNKKLKKKEDIKSLIHILSIEDYETIEKSSSSIKKMTEKILKKTKKLTSKEIEYIKNI